MTDAFGNKLSIGDTVGVSLSTSTSVSNIYKGIVVDFVNRSGYECATIEVEAYYMFKKCFVTRTGKKIVKI